MGLADRVRSRVESRYSADYWYQNFLTPSYFNYGGSMYPYGLSQIAPGLAQTWGSGKIAEVSRTLPAYSAILRSSPPAFAAEMVRALVLSGARFVFRRKFGARSAPAESRTHLFGTPALKLLEEPWPGATTGELLTRMEWHAGLAGASYVLRQRDRLRVLRPDWVAVVSGSYSEPDDPAGALDSELVGYAYANGGFEKATQRWQTLLPDDVAAWVPLPDPELNFVGMSWLTPALRDMQADKSATEHKLSYWANGATPNLVVKGLPAATRQQFDDLVELMESRHAGPSNAYRTLYLTAGADATVVGNNLKDMDLKAVQGAGETRIAFLSRVPAPILGIAEGLAGSSLNAGNFGMARRIFADTWVTPTLQDLVGSLAHLVNVPKDSQLWYDTVDIPLLRDDTSDLAAIIKEQALAIESLTRAGFKADAAVQAVATNNIEALMGQHSGMFSVQMQEPGGKEGPNGKVPTEPPPLNLTRPGKQPVKPDVPKEPELSGVA